MEGIKGFKIFNPDWTCNGFQFEVGKTYEENITPSVCNRGFHFCKQAKDCFNYYTFDPNNKAAEIIALGEIAEEGDKCCTNKIHIVREITWEELLTIVNTGKGNTGLCNTGDYNSGYQNSGDWNSGNRNNGDWNSGNRNSGSYNSGDRNSGYYNSGYRNSGNWNNGDWNSGNGNTGNVNTGNRNSGNYNSGDCNTGNYNTGNYNSGDWNCGDWNKASNTVGCFNTEDQKLKFFDKETNMTFEEWRNSKAYQIIKKIDFKPAVWVWWDEMSDIEKTEHPEYKTTGGYLKICDMTDCYKKWWKGLKKHEKQVIKNIPNFDADKFFMITGIKVSDYDNICNDLQGN